MARSTPIQVAFNGGEVSPLVYARGDLQKYGTCVAQMQNFYPLLAGPASKRQGTRFVAEVKDSSKAVRFERFVFSDEQAYVLEIGDQYIRYYTLEAQLESSPGVPAEDSTPYLEADLFELNFAQSADVLYIVHPDYAPRKLSRTSATNFTLSTIDFFDGPFDDVNSTTTTIAVTGATKTVGSTVTLTASAALFDNARDVGRLIRVRTDGKWGTARISAFTSSTIVSAVVQRELNALASAADTDWRFGAWYPGNYPAVITFHEQRLIFAADPQHPQTFYGSVINDFENFAPTGAVQRNLKVYDDPESTGTGDSIEDENAYRFTIVSSVVDTIRWMSSVRSLIIGTSSGVWAVQSSQQLEAVTPTNISVQRSSTRGSSSITPVNVEDSVLYFSRSKRRGMIVGFSFEADSYTPEDLSILADHLFSTSEAVQVAYANEPNSTAYIVRTDGTLVGLVLELRQRVSAWFRIVVGGEDAVVESVAAIPVQGGVITPGTPANVRHDHVWVLVRRTIDGETKRYVEFLEDEFRRGYDTEDAFFVDSGLTYSGAADDEISGLDHLEGETVSVLADGSKHPDCVVTAGAITLDREASKVQVGLRYSSRLKTLPLESGDPSGSPRGKRKRTDHATLLLDQSLGGQIIADPDAGTFRDLNFGSASDLMGNPVPLFTGDLTEPLLCGWDTTAPVEILHEDPLPFTLLGIVHRVQSSEGGTR